MFFDKTPNSTFLILLCTRSKRRQQQRLLTRTSKTYDGCKFHVAYSIKSRGLNDIKHLRCAIKYWVITGQKETGCNIISSAE